VKSNCPKPDAPMRARRRGERDEQEEGGESRPNDEPHGGRPT
jgi:hypothetical protein